MVCMEGTSFEISALVLGSLGEVELVINTVLINSITILFMVCVPLYLSTIQLEICEVTDSLQPAVSHDIR